MNRISWGIIGVLWAFVLGCVIAETRKTDKQTTDEQEEEEKITRIPHATVVTKGNSTTVYLDPQQVTVYTGSTRGCSPVFLFFLTIALVWLFLNMTS